jgi:hypothetical protein
MAAEKLYWSYEQIQSLIRHAVVEQDVFQDYQPTLIICIAAGGFVPTRMLRSCLKHKLGYNMPIQTIGLQLYEVEGADPTTSPVQRVQWLSYGTGPGQMLLQGHRLLIVDEVDDSRKTLSCAVTELLKDIQLEQQQHEQEHPGRPWAAPDLGIFVVHNKQRKKLAQLPDSIMQNRYFAAAEVPDCWCVYPWDADDIYTHTATAEASRPQLPCTAHKQQQGNGVPAPAPNGSAAGAKQGLADASHDAGSSARVVNEAGCSVACNGSHI